MAKIVPVLYRCCGVCNEKWQADHPQEPWKKHRFLPNKPLGPELKRGMVFIERDSPYSDPKYRTIIIMGDRISEINHHREYSVSHYRFDSSKKLTSCGPGNLDEFYHYSGFCYDIFYIMENNRKLTNEEAEKLLPLLNQPPNQSLEMLLRHPEDDPNVHTRGSFSL